VKLLLTSNGLSNKAIAEAFVRLVGKSVQDIKVAFVPTAGLAEKNDKGWLIDDMYRIKQLGCFVDIVDIAQLPKNEWLPRIEWCDVIFVGGGNAFYLSYWMQKSGLFDELPRLLETRVYAGISAGSMITGRNLVLTTQASTLPQAFVDEDYDKLGPVGRSAAETLNFVEFLVRPHFNSPSFPLASYESIEPRIKDIPETVYAIDDDTAIQVIDDEMAVVSEGNWQKFN
jgi:dipeptidase E